MTTYEESDAVDLCDGYAKEDILARECKFVTHIPRPSHDLRDAHLIKEILHMKDGTRVPNMRMVYDFPRPFYVTAPKFRDHVQKKEMEFTERLMKFECTQSDLRRNVARALNKSWSTESLRDLGSSPYLYGTDIEAATYIKYLYKKKYPDAFCGNTVAGFDVETNIFDEEKKTILMGSMVFKGKAKLAVTKEFLGSAVVTAKYAFDLCVKQNLVGEFNPEDIDFEIVDNDLEVIKACFNWVHPKMPDFVAIWNMDFDIPRILETCKRHNVNVADILSDPRIPPEYRYARYHQGGSSKVTASGVFKTKAIEEQWHTLFLTASFYIIDPMCLYRQLRITSPKEAVNLDRMLRVYVKKSKLTMNLGEGLAKKKWHMYMQQEQKIPYCVYNLYDSKGMLDFDAIMQDIEFTVYTSASYSPYHRINSQPKKITDKYFFFCLEKRSMVLGALPPEVIEDETVEEMKADKMLLERMDDAFEQAKEDYDETDIFSQRGTLGLKGWVLTLDPQCSVLGLQIASDIPDLHTNIRFFVYDSDATAAYPSIIQICNVSKSTTTKELIAIEGIPKEVFRMQNLNFIFGQTNALEYCITMHSLPTPEEMLDLID